MRMWDPSDRCRAMSYRLPPLNGLRAFEAAARHLSFKRAADELCVTAGAISQQVKALETSLGVLLFRRLPRGLLLTDAGEGYLAPISDAFRAISVATDHVAPALRGRRLRLGLSPTLSRPRLKAIDALRKNRDRLYAKLVITDDLKDVIDGRIDALIRRNQQSPPGLHVDRFDLRTAAGQPLPIALVTLPGLAGCREHRELVRLLRNG
jgi:LysR family transcriptional regulator, glycine cleavage system transcriptional activator